MVDNYQDPTDGYLIIAWWEHAGLWGDLEGHHAGGALNGPNRNLITVDGATDRADVVGRSAEALTIDNRVVPNAELGDRAVGGSQCRVVGVRLVDHEAR